MPLESPIDASHRPLGWCEHVLRLHSPFGQWWQSLRRYDCRPDTETRWAPIGKGPVDKTSTPAYAHLLRSLSIPSRSSEERILPEKQWREKRPGETFQDRGRL